MSDPIIGMQQWLETPPGRYLLAWEQAQYARAVADVFGFHALQLGLPEIDCLETNRMPHRWLALDAVREGGAGRAAFASDFSALPFEEASLDLVALPHTLELSADPHGTLREVERVLVPEGRVVVSCLNPLSLWGLRQQRAHLVRRFGFGELFLPDAGEFIGYRRMRDWLRLLGFEVESSSFGCWRPATRHQPWLDRTEWMDRAGARWWPILGAAYFLVAVKRVRGARLIGARWKKPAAIAAAPVPLANRSHRNTRKKTL